MGSVPSDSEGRPSTKLYVYCVVPSTAPKNYGKIGIGGSDAPVQTIGYTDIVAVVSEVSEGGFEKNDETILGHQRVVQKVFDKQMGVPLTFGTVRENSDDVRRLLEEGYDKYKDQLTKLGAFQEPGSQPLLDDTAGSTDLVAQVLEESSASAVKIRQMADELDGIRRKTYEKAMERASDGAMKKLFDLLAHAPPGTVQIREGPSQPAQTAQMERLQKQLYDLAEQLALLVKVQWDKSEKEQQKLSAEIARLQTLRREDILSVEKILRGMFREYFDTVPPALEDLIKKTVRDDVRVLRADSVCLSCGSEIPQTFSFCPHCGRPTKPEKIEQGRVEGRGSRENK